VPTHDPSVVEKLQELIVWQERQSVAMADMLVVLKDILKATKKDK
jgi:hypothetical protein